MAEKVYGLGFDFTLTPDFSLFTWLKNRDSSPFCQKASE